MATALPAHSVIQVRMVGELFGQQVMNVLHYQWGSGVAAPDYRNVMENTLNAFTVAGELYDSWTACMSVSVEQIKLYAQPVYPTRLSAVRVIPLIVAGQVHGTDMATNCAATVTKETDVAARWGRGSVHVPGMVVESLDVDTNEWDGVQIGHLTTFGELVKKTYTLDDFVGLVPILFDHKTPLRQTPITGYIVQNNPRVSRRRTLRVGR